MRALVVVLAFALASVACSPADEAPTPTPEPSPTPAITQEDISSAVLDSEDVDEGWTEEADTEHNTVQIGGEVGAANVVALAEAVSSFSEDGGTAFVSNSVFLMPSEDLARQVIGAHERAAERTTWEQERTDEASAFFEISGEIGQLAGLGQQRFTAAIDARITEDGEETIRRVQYVVYRVGSVLGFVVAQNTPAAPFARRQLAKVERIVT